MIQINLFRISADGKYLDMILDCPTNYRVNSLSLKQYNYVSTGDGDSGWRDFSSLIPENSGTRLVARLDLLDLELNGEKVFSDVSIFYGKIQAN
jgi:hypothetical protein